MVRGAQLMIWLDIFTSTFYNLQLSVQLVSSFQHSYFLLLLKVTALWVASLPRTSIAKSVLLITCCFWCKWRAAAIKRLSWEEILIVLYNKLTSYLERANYTLSPDKYTHIHIYRNSQIVSQNESFRCDSTNHSIHNHTTFLGQL